MIADTVTLLSIFTFASYGFKSGFIVTFFSFIGWLFVAIIMIPSQWGAEAYSNISGGTCLLKLYSLFSNFNIYQKLSAALSVLVALTFVSHSISNYVKRSAAFSDLNKHIGFIFGVFKGIFIVFCLYNFIYLHSSYNIPAIDNSKTKQIFDKIIFMHQETSEELLFFNAVSENAVRLINN